MGEAQPRKERAGMVHSVGNHRGAAVQRAYAPAEHDSHVALYGGHRTECLPRPGRSTRIFPKLRLWSTERDTQARHHLLPEQSYRPGRDADECGYFAL